MRVKAWLPLLAALLGCGGASSRHETNNAGDSETGDPPECQTNGFDVAAAALGGASAGMNGGRNTALEAIHERCERAREAQRFNAKMRAEAEADRIQLERMRRDSERQRAAAAREAAAIDILREALERCAAGVPSACRAGCEAGFAASCTVYGSQLLKGERVPRDPDEAAAFFELACKGGESNGCAALQLLRQPAAPTRTAPSSPSSPPRVLIFGGKDHKTFLGCFCGPNAPNSVENDTGKFGKHGFNVEGPTLWSVMSPFRSRFEDVSACNRFASDPPVIVRDDGTFLARLTINTMLSGAVRDESVLKWLNEEVCSSP